MNCLNCQTQFDQNLHIPRLLPHCGHTLCQYCIKSLINSNFIICTQCHQLNMAFKENDLPKNLAIMTLQNQSKRYNTSLQQLSYNSKQFIKEKQNPLCMLHGKKLQAFCMKCCEHMCLQCVINHPKQHELKTLQEAAISFQQEAKRILRFEKDLKLNLKYQKLCIQKNQISNIVNMHKVKLMQCFSELKNYIQQKQTQLVALLKNSYDIQVNRLLQQQKQLDIFQKIYIRINQISQTDCLRQLIKKFKQNQNILNPNKHKILIQNLQKKQKNLQKQQIYNWEDNFIKIKQKIIKDIKNILQNRSELKQKLILPSKQTSHTGSVQNLSINSKSSTTYRKKETNRNYKTDKNNKGQKQNKQIYISLKDLDSNYSKDTVKNSILIYGGYIEENHQSIEIYGSKFKINKNQNSAGHVKFGIISLGKSIYIFGGKKQNKRIDNIYKLSSIKFELKEIGRLTKGKSGFGYCKKNNFCYVVGGNDGNILSQFQEYDFQNQKVKCNFPRLNIQRDELTLVNYKNELYAIGGYNLQSQLSLSSIEKYNFQTKKWIFAPNMNIPRRSHNSIVLQSGIYVVGGYDGKNYLSTIQRFNDQQNRWKIVCQMMEQRCTFGIVQGFKNQGFYVFGGFAHQPMETCQFFSVQLKKSYPIQNLKCKRFMLGCALLTQQFKV